MLIDICLGTRTAWKILLVMAEAPGKGITGGEIKKFTKAGNKALTRSLLMFELFDLISKAKIGRQYIYRLNLANPHIGSILQLIQKEKEGLNNIPLPQMALLREFAYDLLTTSLDDVRHVYLFGSHAKRTSLEGSDIDLAIILKAMSPATELLITQSIDELKKRFGMEIQPHYYTEDEFREQKGDTLIPEILRDGINIF